MPPKKSLSADTPQIVNLASHYQYLSQLPDSLYGSVVTLHYGTLDSRVTGILNWRAYLLAGQIPDLKDLQWPSDDIRKIILTRIKALNMIEQCKNEESLVDEILLQICKAIESIIKRRQQGIDGLFDDVLGKSNKKDPVQSETSVNDDETEMENDKNSASPGDGELNESLNDGNLESINKTMSLDDIHTDERQYLSINELSQFDRELSRPLEQLFNRWQDIKMVFSDMQMKPGRGWDLSSGILASIGWQEIVSLRREIKKYPQLTAIVNQLGRSHAKKRKKGALPNEDKKNEDSDETTVEQDIKSIDPMCLDGIVRGDDVARMLPSEAVLLGHKKLKMLWHAKRAEHALLSYQSSGVMSSSIPQPYLAPNKENNQTLAAGDALKGPLVICVDASGSMRGLPEIIAKAITLDVVRLANQEKRPCYLFTFSGTGQHIEAEISFTKNGLKDIIQFLQKTFRGGTDVSSVIESALKKISEKKWKKSDVLVISDGIFQLTTQQFSDIKLEQKKFGTRIHGLIVGDWRGRDMGKLCEPLHKFDEWQIAKT